MKIVSSVLRFKTKRIVCVYENIDVDGHSSLEFQGYRAQPEDILVFCDQAQEMAQMIIDSQDSETIGGFLIKNINLN